MSACSWSGCDERQAAWRTGPRARKRSSINPARPAAACSISAAASARPAARPNSPSKRASGEGTVYATSLVCRAATPETRAHLPYNIVLVDTPEGFRMMAHGDNDLAIGDRVTARFVAFAGRLVPYFERRDR